jgi:hypothetical protein
VLLELMAGFLLTQQLRSPKQPVWIVGNHPPEFIAVINTVSADTLLRRVRSIPDSVARGLLALGVDDFASGKVIDSAKRVNYIFLSTRDAPLEICRRSG